MPAARGDRRDFITRANLRLVYVLQAIAPTFRGDKQSLTRIRDARRHLAQADKELAGAERMALLEDGEPPPIEGPPNLARMEFWPR